MNEWSTFIYSPVTSLPLTAASEENIVMSEDILEETQSFSGEQHSNNTVPHVYWYSFVITFLKKAHPKWHCGLLLSGPHSGSLTSNQGTFWSITMPLISKNSREHHCFMSDGAFTVWPLMIDWDGTRVHSRDLIQMLIDLQFKPSLKMEVHIPRGWTLNIKFCRKGLWSVAAYSVEEEGTEDGYQSAGP